MVKIDIFLLLTRRNGIIVSVLPKKIKEFFMFQTELNPAFKENNVPVVFATDDKYFPYLAVTLASLKAHASPAYCYDLVVLCLGVSQKNKTLLSSMFEEVSNFSLRFVEMDDFFAGNSFFIDKYLSLSTYSRLFIAQIFARYQKVIYLDCDLLINADIREMFDIELGDKLLLCCRDFGFASGTIRKSPIFGDRYAETKLKIDNFLDYFNAGVLVFNVQAIRKQGIDKILLENVKEIEKPLFHDQDILNATCYRKVVFLPYVWNFIANDVAKLKCLPEDYQKEYELSEKNPKIIHFAGRVKPWQSKKIPFSSLWWMYARQCPFFERILEDNEASLYNSGFKVKKYQFKILGFIVLGHVVVEVKKTTYFWWKIPVLRIKRKDGVVRMSLFGLELLKIKKM